MSKFIEATYLWCSMAGSYHVDCKIYAWDDKTERFAISYYDSILEEEVRTWAPYDRISDYTWQSLSEKLKLS